jgi:hypothetical protein
MKKMALLAAVLLVTPGLFGQALTIGSTYGGSPNSSDSAIASTRTDVSLQPASANGTIDTVHVYWSSLGCTNALKIKFFHRVGNTLTLTAERGPFTSTSSDMTLPISPAVTVQQGDLIGVARVANCGNPGALFGVVGVGFVAFSGDVTGSFDITSGTNVGSTLFLYGTGTATSSIARVMTVAGSVAGALGSQFRTQVQLFNPYSSAITGTLVYHPASTSGSSADPSLPYTIAAGRVTVFDDIVPSFGLTGLGTIDFVVPTGGSLPITITRVYNDAGSAGTSGLTEDLVATTGDNRVLVQGATGFLVAPPDPTKARINIGIRSLTQGATLTATLKDGITGVVRSSVTKTYQPNWFEQPSASSLFSVPIGANDIIQVSVGSGSVIIYGSTTDNTTNDPALQFMTVTFAVA